MSNDDLRALAKAATPGPWHAGEGDALLDGVWAEAVTASPDEDGIEGHLVAWCHSEWRDRDDAAYIAAAGPDRILALLDERDRLRAALRSANEIIAMTRQHLTTDHPECAYTALGVMNDADRNALASWLDPAP